MALAKLVLFTQAGYAPHFHTFRSAQKLATLKDASRFTFKLISCSRKPTPEQDANQITPFLVLQARLQAGEKLYIHCWGGRGRSALVGACLLVAAYGIGAEEALERVQRSYDTRGDQQPSSPETEPQKECVRKFAASLGRQ